jgi:hypothetical protein
MYKKLRYGLIALLAFVGLTASAQVTFDFEEDYATLFPTVTFDSEGIGAIINDAKSIAIDGYTVTVSVGDDPEKNANCIWNNTPRLRIYSGTITISGSGIETIIFNHGGKFTLATNSNDGELEGNVWTGSANEVVFYIPAEAGSTQLKSIVINGEVGNDDIREVTIAKFLEAEDSEDVWYQLTGTVGEIKNKQYGNFYLEDASGSVYVYGLAEQKGGQQSGSFTKLGIEEGDILTIIGNRYTHIKDDVITDEVTNAYFVDLEKGQTPEPTIQNITVEDFIAEPVSTTEWYRLRGMVTNLKDGDKYGNFDLVDKTGSVYVYGVLSEKGGDKKKFQELVGKYGIKNGGYITIIGNRGYYAAKDQIQVANAYFEDYEDGADPETFEVNVTEALEVIDALADNQTAFDYYQVTGYVVGAPNYDNGYEGKFTGTVDLYLSDTKDGEAKLFVYHGLGLDNEKFTGDDDLDLFVEGDQVTFLGKLQKYVDKDKNTKLELKDCYLVKASASLEMPASGLATFCSPYPIEIEDQNVYIVTQVGKDKALVQKVEAGIIESGTGLLVEGSGTVNIAYAYGEKGNALSGNMLVGTLKEKDIAKGEAYILKDGAFHLSNAGTFPARKAYLPVDAASGAKIFIDFSGTTAINEVKAQNENIEIYTIGGIRVKNAQQKGVYIINGKKVVK